MRKNEFTSLEQFASQYTGEWSPSDGHWYGLDFIWHGKEYRFQTGSMYNEENTVLPDGREAMFGLYRKKDHAANTEQEYELLGEYADIKSVMQSTVIEVIPFAKIIMDDSTELTGQD